MRAAFETAMSQSPSVLLIDELDGISSRSHISGRYSEYWTQIVNLMLELVTKALATEGVVIVGATNFVERIDPALTRSGRLDQIIKIDPPNEVELTLILSAYVGLKHPTPELKALAGRLRGKTGADIRSMVRSAKSAARRSGQEFSVANLEALVRDPRDRLPASARRRLAIYQAGQIVATRALGLVEVSREYPKDDDAALSFSKDPFLTEQNCNDILVALVAGRAAEEILMAEVSVMGAWNENSDLASATRLAGDMETRFGFGETGLIYLDGYVSDHVMSTMVVGSIRRRIEMAMTRASTLLLENRQELEAIVTQLVRAAPLQSHAENIRV
jgi:ATP-dependent Zn protease